MLVGVREEQRVEERSGAQRGSPYMERKATQVILSHRHARAALSFCPTHTHTHTHIQNQNENTRVQIHIRRLTHSHTFIQTL